jgi:hypothetical protein
MQGTITGITIRIIISGTAAIFIAVITTATSAAFIITTADAAMPPSSLAMTHHPKEITSIFLDNLF